MEYEKLKDFISDVKQAFIATIVLILAIGVMLLIKWFFYNPIEYLGFYKQLIIVAFLLKGISVFYKRTNSGKTEHFEECRNS
jgi:hypothetical protein